MSVVVLVADGARLDALAGDLEGLPALKRLRDEGGLHPITTVFPSVTGPAYAPFLVGRFPGDVGIPGIRWYDRERTACRWPDYSRSYVGHQFAQVNDDLDANAPTMFELVPRSIGALSVMTRGLAPENRHGTLTVRSALRVAMTHFGGHPERWLDIDREVLHKIPERIRTDRPDFVFAALTGVDKASHARGHDSELVREALRIVDATAARIREDAERSCSWDTMHLWIVSDHGHETVHSHEDLVQTVSRAGWRTMSHPFTMSYAPEVAVMVSGNAMAHLYVQLDERHRSGWARLQARWKALADVVLALAATDLMLLPADDNSCEVRSRDRGSALVQRIGCELSYAQLDGDPLGVASDLRGTPDEMHDALSASEYPDALAQILALAGSKRSGDIILSSASGWDFRARYEPIPHRSAHGALRREHMMVPLLTNKRPARAPRRTTDVFASAIAALGVTAPKHLDGRSWID